VSRSATARLFVAVDPPADVCRELAAWARLALAVRERGSRIRLLDPETMHVTLCFLGARPIGDIDVLSAAIEECSTEACALRIGAPLWLPPRDPRAVALEVLDDEGALTRLHARVSALLASAIDWAPERRRFRAHVTVARLGRDAARGAGRARRRDGRGEASEADHAARAGSKRPADGPLPPSPQRAFSPRELVLYRSRLSPDGASYEAITTRALDTSPASSEPSSPSSSAAGGVGPEPRQTSAAPSSRGRAPSSHSGAEPSSQT
jgi:RNA 2',3'-cyclic 3'-phosphodiesterase